MKNGAAIDGDNESTKGAMQIREKTRAPMGTRRQRNLQRTKFHGLPIVELMHDIEAKVVHQVPYANRHDNRLVCRNPPQSAPVEVIKMRVRHQNEIDRGQMVNFETRLFEPLDHLQPFRPERIDQDIGFVGLNQERRMANPGNADFALRIFGKCGCTPSPARLVKSEGIRTVVRKLRLCQSERGRSLIRVERLFLAPFSEG